MAASAAAGAEGNTLCASYWLCGRHFFRRDATWLFQFFGRDEKREALNRAHCTPPKGSHAKWPLPFPFFSLDKARRVDGSTMTHAFFSLVLLCAHGISLQTTGG